MKKSPTFFKIVMVNLSVLWVTSISTAQVFWSLDESVAIVEWQFPTDATLALHPFQKRILTDACCLSLGYAFAPNLSEWNSHDTPETLNKLTQHAQSLFQSVAAGRKNFTPPLQMNFSDATPQAMEFLIRKGVRIFSFSSAIRDESWIELEKVIRDHPEVIFVFAIPHISGNSIEIEALEETPIHLVKEGLSNIVLAGEIRAYAYHTEKHHSGLQLGSLANPFEIANQPGGEKQRRYYMLNPASTAVLNVMTKGGTSIAAPHLAHLISLAVADLKTKNKETDLESVLRHLESVMNETMAVDKVVAAPTKPVLYFTLDTVLANLGEPLRTEAVWNFGVPPLAAPQVF